MPNLLPKSVEQAERSRRAASGRLEPDRQHLLGQFLTPPDVARLMASMFTELPPAVRLLDAGAGAGSLTAAFVEEACGRTQRPSVIETTAFEVDAGLATHLQRTVRQCRAMCREADVRFLGKVRRADFLVAATANLSKSLFADRSLSFNAAILNPPYLKIGSESLERRRLRDVGLDATNLYAAFVSLSLRLLEPGGQLVVIIPRSFCNGPYFRPFRNILLTETTIVRVHLFDSRRDAFRDDAVLQENVILHVAKTPQRTKKIVISSSRNASSPVRSRRVEYSQVVRGTGAGRFLYLPIEEDDDATTSWIGSLPATLTDLGISVSTGRVVDFRAKEFLRPLPVKGAVPLIYPAHFSEGFVRWPRLDTKKPNAIVDNEMSASLLVPSGHYVLIKRFSSKEERRRVVAAVLDPTMVPASHLGFENHLNYFHRDGSGLDRDIVLGLATFLNCTKVDKYFRQFSGHTQVNATDLRSLRYPSVATLRKLGRAFEVGLFRDQGAVDAAMDAAN